MINPVPKSVVSSHDAYDNMDFRKVVDVHPDFPSKQSLSAIYEMCRYFISLFTKQKIPDYNNQTGDVFNSGFLSFHRYTQEKNIPFFIYLHPDKQEIVDNKYDIRGEEIIRFCRDNCMHLIEGLKYENISLFSDEIHPNEQGHKILANILLKEIMAKVCWQYRNKKQNDA
jgi:hypothetical protein